MIETEPDLLQIEMEGGSGHTPILVEPVFGIRPKSFDPVDLVPPFWLPFHLGGHHVVAPHGQGSVVVPVVGVVQAAPVGVTQKQGQAPRPTTARIEEGQHLPISLVEAKHDHLAGCSPSSLTCPSTSEHRLVRFHQTAQERPFLKRVGVDRFPGLPIDAQYGRRSQGNLEPQAFARYAQREIADQFADRPAGAAQSGDPCLSLGLAAGMMAMAARPPTMGENPASSESAVWTTPSHDTIVVSNLENWLV